MIVKDQATSVAEQTSSRTELLIKGVRKMPFFRQTVPQEAGVGWPIPLRKEGKIYVTLPFFGFSPTAAAGKTQLYPPLAIATLDWSNQLLVEYVNLRFRPPAPELDWTKQVGTFPHPAVSQITVAQYRQLRQELLTMYDQMFDLLGQNNPLAPEWSQRFAELLNTLVEPPLIPYYRALNPKFFARFLG
jgi:hypothetical protein